MKLRRLVLDETDLKITSQLTKPRLGRCGEVRTVAALFCDIPDVTSLSQRLTPYDLMFVLNRYFFRMADAIERHKGLVEKLIGDAIMATFDLHDTPDFPLRAVKAATDTLGAADEMTSYMKAMYDLAFAVGIGLHYGEAVIGTVSGGREEKLAAIGETVDVASRIEGANKEAGTRGCSSRKRSSSKSRTTLTYRTSFAYGPAWLVRTRSPTAGAACTSSKDSIWSFYAKARHTSPPATPAPT